MVTNVSFIFNSQPTVKSSKVVNFIGIIVLLFIMVSCGAINKSMQSWVGHTKAELYQSLGPPTRVTEDGQGGEILIYEQYINTGQTPGQVYQDYNGNVRYTNPQQNGYSRTRMFYVNERGVIYSWRWQGL